KGDILTGFIIIILGGVDVKLTNLVVIGVLGSIGLATRKILPVLHPIPGTSFLRDTHVDDR
ncbi:hypothetical protein J1785_04990, partial [Rahnella sp. SL6]|uniref:hypothetical protein n=1 Tax=Rahnella perminowiae TaxID=2816244 RepID=UPI001C25F79E